MYNGSLIKGLQQSNITYGCRLFYAWMVLEYGYDKWVSFEQLENYCSRRQVFRHIKQLEQSDMIESEYRTHGRKYIKAT